MARPVGVTVAKKQQQALRKHAAEADEGWEERGASEKPATGNTSWRVFLEGSFIYLLCVFIPSLLGYLIRLYSDYKESHADTQTPEEPTDTSWMTSASELFAFAKEETESYLCASSSEVGVSQSWAEYAGMSWLCPSKKDEDKDILWSPDAQWTDLGTVAFLSLLLATVRIFILYAIVPLQEPHRLSAVIRCKSVHLLSRDYGVLTPHGTPVPRRKMAPTNLSGAQLGALQIPDISVEGSTADEDASHLGLSLDDDDREDLNLSSPPRGVPDAPEFIGEDEETFTQEGFNSAPRLATASFRLVYSGLVAAVAYYFFAKSEFWPIYVGGSGKTAACWDLSGGLSVAGVDGDFDAQNTALRQYYLTQSAYHWHSGAFHLLSVLLMFLRPKEKRPGWIQDSTSSYQRSFLQHSVAILLLSTTYVFSSLRRLGAIGMFVFDVSSCCLHLLQICLNSPKNSILRSPKLSIFVYRFLVLPSFIYCRFIVWSILWWSAVTESGNWLKQLDRILFSGSSLMLQTLWHVCMAGSMILNLVYLRRLWNHPHLSRIIRGPSRARD